MIEDPDSKEKNPIRTQTQGSFGVLIAQDFLAAGVIKQRAYQP